MADEREWETTTDVLQSNAPFYERLTVVPKSRLQAAEAEVERLRRGIENRERELRDHYESKVEIRVNEFRRDLESESDSLRAARDYAMEGQESWKATAKQFEAARDAVEAKLRELAELALSVLDAEQVRTGADGWTETDPRCLLHNAAEDAVRCPCGSGRPMGECEGEHEGSTSEW